MVKYNICINLRHSPPFFLINFVTPTQCFLGCPVIIVVFANG